MFHVPVLYLSHVHKRKLSCVSICVSKDIVEYEYTNHIFICSMYMCSTYPMYINDKTQACV